MVEALCNYLRGLSQSGDFLDFDDGISCGGLPNSPSRGKRMDVSICSGRLAVGHSDMTAGPPFGQVNSRGGEAIVLIGNRVARDEGSRDCNGERIRK